MVKPKGQGTGDSIVCEQPFGSKAENAFVFGGALGREGVSAAI